MSLGPNYLHYNPMPIDAYLFSLLSLTLLAATLSSFCLQCNFAFDCNFNFASDIDFVLVFGFLLVTFCCFGFLGRVIVHSAHTHKHTDRDTHWQQQQQEKPIAFKSQFALLPIAKSPAISAANSIALRRCCAACCAQNSTKNSNSNNNNNGNQIDKLFIKFAPLFWRLWSINLFVLSKAHTTTKKILIEILRWAARNQHWTATTTIITTQWDRNNLQRPHWRSSAQSWPKELTPLLPLES